eukprot:986093-Lingulodinium_polyedra.AAC.1
MAAPAAAVFLGRKFIRVSGWRARFWGERSSASVDDEPADTSTILRGAIPVGLPTRAKRRQ